MVSAHQCELLPAHDWSLWSKRVGSESISMSNLLIMSLTLRRRLAAISTALILSALPALAQAPSTNTHVYDPKIKGGHSITDLLAAIHTREGEYEKHSRQFAEESRSFPPYRGDGQDSATKIATSLKQAAVPQKSHASWCTPCRLMLHLLEDSKASPIIKSRYVIVDVDVFERSETGCENPGGEAIYRRYGGDGSIPFCVVLTSSGHFVRNSMANGRNLGYPGELASISSFMKMLQTSEKPFSNSDLALMKETLTEAIPS
jgi:thiol-disulfide isomerase/thioredoxin